VLSWFQGLLRWAEIFRKSFLPASIGLYFIFFSSGLSIFWTL
jgi:hypothetical protein